jgi:tetratricopeptide (TPR) repeat protein
MHKTVALFVLLTAMSYAQGQKREPSAKIQARGSKSSDTATEDRLRFRLQFNPHDATAHKQLVDLLQKKNAFRAIVMEDANWLSNNRGDSFALVELVSYAEAALHDPEYAIAQLRLQLSSVQREDDPNDFDDWSDQLAAKLQERGRPEEALPLFSELVRLNPNEAGFWADYGDVLSDLGRNEDAAKAFRRSISLNPSMEAFHEGFAEALVKSGDLRGAESEYRAALSLYDAQYKTGEPTDSYHSFIRSMVKIEKENGAEHGLAETRLKLAHVLLLAKKFDDAIVQAQAALDADHSAFVALYLEAEINDAKGDPDQASKTREHASLLIRKEAASEHLKGATADVDPRVIFLEDSLWNNHRSNKPALPSEVVSILTPRIASLSPFERVMLATAYFAFGNASDGKRQWEMAMSANHELDNAVGNANLGEELLKAGSFQDALPHLQRAYELDPQNTTYRIDYESVRQRLGK